MHDFKLHIVCTSFSGPIVLFRSGDSDLQDMIIASSVEFWFPVLHNFRFQLVQVFGFHSTLQGPSACCKVSSKEKGKVLDLTRNFVFV